MEANTLKTECGCCGKFFIIAYQGDEHPEHCPFCAAAMEDVVDADAVEDDEPVDSEALDYDESYVDKYEDEDSIME